LKLYKLL